jgi:ABC-type antimicrobial peptide transport system permease subunit
MILSNTISMIREHPLRGFLSLLALFAGSFLMGSAWSIADGIDRLVQAAWGVQGTAMVLANGTTTADGNFERTMPPQFDASTADIIAQAIPGAGAVSPVTNVPFGRVQAGDKQYQIRRILGVGASYLQTMGLKLVAGQSFGDQDIKSKKAVVVISEEIAKGIFGSAEAAVGKSLQTVMQGPGGMGLARANAGNAAGSGGNAAWAGNNAAPRSSGLRRFQIPSQKFTVVGVYATPDDTSRRRLGLGDAVVPYNASTPGRLNIPESFYWGTVVFTAKGVTVDAARIALQQAFMAAKGDLVKVSVWQGNPNNPDVRNQNTAQSLESLASLVRVLGLVLALVAGVGMYGIMTVEVAGRSKHYGIRRALGASAPDIVKLVAGQASGMALLGSSGGLILSALLTNPILHGLSPWLSLVGLKSGLVDTIGFSFLPYLIALALIMTFSSVFGLIPAFRVLKASPVALLREES